MKDRAKTITLLLIDGTSTGSIKCTLANWTGIAYKIPRTEINRCKDRKDLKQSGVYFLFGKSKETGESVVYVGQAGVRKKKEGIILRLLEHKRNPDKDYWTEAVIFTTSNDSFGATEISYLENRFCNMAIDAERYKVKNSNDPAPGHITEEKESELEEFIDYAKIVIGTLGYSIFEPLDKEEAIIKKPASSKPVQKQEIIGDEMWYLRRTIKSTGKTIEAKCKQTEEGFVVLKGSMINTIDLNSIPPGVKKARNNAVIDNNGILQEDVYFKSPSSAATFVNGSSTNGLIEWKKNNGKTLKEIKKCNKKMEK